MSASQASSLPMLLLAAVAWSACGSGKDSPASSGSPPLGDTGDTGTTSDTDDSGSGPMTCAAPVWLPGDYTPAATDLAGICAEGNAIEGDLILEGLDLTDARLAELDCLCAVGGNLLITGTGLTDLTALRSLESAGSLEVVDNTLLETLDGLSALATVDGPLQVARNASLARIEGLSALTSTGPLSLIELPVVNFRGLESLVTVGGDLTLDQLPNIVSMQGLSALDFVDGNFLVSNTGDHDFSGLNRIRRVRNAFVVADSLATLDGLDSLATVGGTVQLQRVSQLRDLNGLSGLSGIGGHLRIEDAGLLNSISGMNSLQGISGSVWLERTNVGSLAPLQTTLSVGGLRLDTNPELTSTAGMPPVIALSELVLHWNASLDELTGLNTVRTIEGDLMIDGHVQLGSLVDLMDVISVGGDLSVQNNTVLSGADGEALRDAIGEENIGGTITISGNGG